jgi:hypothetical protein
MLRLTDSLSCLVRPQAVLKPINCLSRVTISNPLALAALGRSSLTQDSRFMRCMLALEINSVLVPLLYSVLVARSGCSRSDGVVHQVGGAAMPALLLLLTGACAAIRHCVCVPSPTGC